MDLVLLMRSYRRAVEARLRYTLAQSGGGRIDPKVDHVLLNHVADCQLALERAGGTDSAWFRRVWKDVTEQVWYDLSVGN